MSWREQLKPASYRDIPFYVDSISLDYGRVLNIDRPGASVRGGVLTRFKTIPDLSKAEETIIKDMGIRETEILINAYFIGDNYIENRLAFERAFREGGIHSLILPLEDPINVHPNRARRRFSNKEGGIEYLEISFIVATTPPEDRITVDTTQNVISKAEVSISSAEQAFEEIYTIQDAAPFVVQEAEDAIEDFTNIMGESASYGAPSFSYEDWLNDLDSLALDAAELIRTPETLVSKVVQAIQRVRTAFVSVESAFYSQVYLFNNIGSIFPDITGFSKDRSKQRNNRVIFNSTVRVACIAEMCSYSSEQSFVSREEALSRLDNLLRYIDELLKYIEGTAADSLFDTLQELRSSIIADMKQRAAQLPSIITVKTSNALPLMSFCYDVYGDLDEYEGLVLRNQVENPNACPFIMEIVSP